MYDSQIIILNNCFVSTIHYIRELWNYRNEINSNFIREKIKDNINDLRETKKEIIKRFKELEEDFDFETSINEHKKRIEEIKKEIKIIFPFRHKDNIKRHTLKEKIRFYKMIDGMYKGLIQYYNLKKMYCGKGEKNND